MSDRVIVFDHAVVLDVVNGQALPDHKVVVRSGKIEWVGPQADAEPVPPDAHLVDVGGKVVMPGLSDAHVHVTAWTGDVAAIARSSPAYSAARAGALLEAMLMRGFTTVRDGGGADYGLALAVEQEYLTGPRVLFCGHALSPTAGHGDMRGRGERAVLEENESGAMAVLCDGVPAVRMACREEIRRGANHIKLMLSGGVASPTDRLTNLQFSADEVRAAVEEAEMAGIYCMGHAYTPAAINRGLRLGVRSLEHCNLADESSMELFLEHDAYMVPTLATYEALAQGGAAAGLPSGFEEKLAPVLEGGIQALRLAHEAGVNLVYGTDLLGDMQVEQLNEFALRGQVQPAADVIRAATANAAKLFNEVGQMGVVATGARADLLVVDGSPLDDLKYLQDPDRYLKAIMKDGIFYKDEL